MRRWGRTNYRRCGVSLRTWRVSERRRSVSGLLRRVPRPSRYQQHSKEDGKERGAAANQRSSFSTVLGEPRNADYYRPCANEKYDELSTTEQDHGCHHRQEGRDGADRSRRQ